jgi:5-methylcytosine-specific restriction endonuclease McrA
MKTEDDQQLRCLVLSSTMQPESTMRWDKAVVLAVLNKVDVLEEYDVSCNSPSKRFQIPAVIRLRRYVNKHKGGVKFSRNNVYARDGFKCCFCNKQFSPRHLNYDHVLPRVRGGKTVWENIVTSCYKCNGKKGNRTPQEAGMRMHFKPHRPSSLPDSTPLLLDMSRVPEIWLPYLTSAALIA